MFVFVTHYFFAWPQIKCFMAHLETNSIVRASVMHACVHGEAIALQRGGNSELIRNHKLMTHAINKGFSERVYREKYKGLDYFVDVAVQAAYFLLVAPRVFKGTLVFGVSQAMYIQVLTVSGITRGFCAMLTQISPSFVASTRLSVLVKTLEEAAQFSGSEGIALEADGVTAGIALELEAVTLRTPRRSAGARSLALLGGVSVHLPMKATLVIAGESGIGKSSLLRALGGLWSNGPGTIRRPCDEATFFVSQQPYLCLGSLRDQLLYPRGEQLSVSNAELERVAKMVGLQHLLANPGLDGETGSDEEMLRKVVFGMHWTNKLSLGEVQCINFGRLLLQKGIQLVLFDEGTSAVDVGHEAAMYTLLRSHVESYVSVAHRPQLRRFHSHALVLERSADGVSPGTGRFLPMEEYDHELVQQAATSAAF